MTDLLINREQALARERELEAEIVSLREQNATLRAEVERLTKDLTDSNAAVREWRGQYWQELDEVRHLQAMPSCGLPGCQRCAEIDAMIKEGGAE